MSIRLLVVLCGLMLGLARAEDTHSDHEGHGHEVPDYIGGDSQVPVRLPAEIVEAMRNIPVQDGGRVKPLDTYARFKLLKIHGKRRIRAEVGAEKLEMDAAEWLVQTLIYPERMTEIPLFVVDNSEVIVSLGGLPHAARNCPSCNHAVAAFSLACERCGSALNTGSKPAEAKKRDRYSYSELYPLRAKLYELSQQHGLIEPRKRSPAQNGVVNLAHNVSDFEFLMHHLDFARERLDVEASLLPGVFGPATNLSVSAFLARLPEVRRSLFESASSGGHENNPAVESISELVSRLLYFSEASVTLFWHPPPAPDDSEWRSAGALIEGSMRSDEVSPHSIRHLEALEGLVAARDGIADGSLLAAVQRLAVLVTGDAAARGEGEKVLLEVSLYRGNFFFWSLFWFLVSFGAIALSWLRKTPARPGSLQARLGRVLVYGPLIAAIVYLVAGITLRCIIRGRPPVTNLYETVLFITALTVIVALVVEWISREKIALALTPVLGALGMFLANKYEMKEAVDTMPSLIAVLNTNFWLSTHVTCITTGYAAGLLAGGLAHIYLLGKVIGFKRTDPDFYRSVARMTYGVVCFGLLFSFVGTMLGGVWANYSWGRFWGWDPKENGALMIVLWSLIILHARMGGYIRDFGLCVLSIIGAAIVAFSWWGVNLLGIGLHSYGFTSGIAKALITYWSIEAAVVAMSLAWYAMDRRSARTAPTS